MNNKLLSTLTGVSALALLAGGAAATPAEPPAAIPVAHSFADLLEPVPDAVAILRADDKRAEAAQGLQLAQFDGGGYGHHHHHHHFQRFYHDGPVGYGFGFRRHFDNPYRHHHHHHHHHFRRYYGD